MDRLIAVQAAIGEHFVYEGEVAGAEASQSESAIGGTGAAIAPRGV
jgi:hypothetical protein